MGGDYRAIARSMENEIGEFERRVMKTGDSVMIYEDPITRQKEEGMAELRNLRAELQDGYELWEVRFPDGELRQRIVLVRNKYEVVTLEKEYRKYVYLVEAVNKQEAEKKVMNGEGDCIDDYLVSGSLEGIESVNEVDR